MENNPILSLKNISLTLEGHQILKNINLELNNGDIACLLGPSGCGKTSLFRIIAGLEERASGNTTLNKQIVQSEKVFIPPQRRKIGMVFQDYALFPHLNVAENITFGIGNLPKSEINKKLEEMLELTKLTQWRNTYPHKLSGGQQQRVALARALAQNPSIILLDEPFSNLDTELRYQLSHDVRNILKKLNMTAILVTHDQTEAFSFADKMGVMNDGKIEQFSSTYNLYHIPETPFVARFVGEGVIVPGDLLATYIPDSISKIKNKILVRPDDIVIDEKSSIKASISKKIFRGSHFLYTLNFPNGLQVLCLAQSHYNYNINDVIGVRLEINQIVEFA